MNQLLMPLPVICLWEINVIIITLKEYQLYRGNPFLGIRRVVGRPRPDVESVVGPVERRQLGAHVHPLLAQLPPLVSRSVMQRNGIPRIIIKWALYINY
jgi:hypothetical protein